MSNYEKITTGMGEECGVFGAYDMDGGDVALSVYYGLFALQHRGQESCGIAVTDTYGERKVHSKKGLGLVNEVFDEEALEGLKGNLGRTCPLFNCRGNEGRKCYATCSELCERYSGNCP